MGFSARRDSVVEIKTSAPSSPEGDTALASEAISLATSLRNVFHQTRCPHPGVPDRATAPVVGTLVQQDRVGMERLFAITQKPIANS
jgi:hypothetical protein